MIVSLLLSLPSDFHIEIITSGDVSAESSMLLSLQKKRKKDGRQQHSDNNMASMLDILIRHKVSQFKYSDSLALSPSLFVCLCVYMLPVFSLTAIGHDGPNRTTIQPERVFVREMYSHSFGIALLGFGALFVIVVVGRYLCCKIILISQFSL